MATPLNKTRLRVCEKEGIKRSDLDLIGEWLHIGIPGDGSSVAWRIGLVLGCRVKQMDPRIALHKIYVLPDEKLGFNEVVFIRNLGSVMWEVAEDRDVPDSDDIFIGSRVAIPCLSTYPTKELRRKAHLRFKSESVSYYEAFIVARASERRYKFIVTDEEDVELMMKVRYIPFARKYPNWCKSLKMKQSHVDGLHVVTWSREE